MAWTHLAITIMHVEVNVNAVLGCVGRFDEEEVVRFVVTVNVSM